MNFTTVKKKHDSLISRSSRPDVFCEKGVLRNFAKFTGKHLRQSLFFNKVACAASNFIKKETLTQVFRCEFCEICKKTFFNRTPLVAASESEKWQKILSETKPEMCDSPSKKSTLFVTFHLHRTKKKFSVEYFFEECDQIRSFLLIWSHLLKKI